MPFKIAHISDIHLGYKSGKKIHPITKNNLRLQDGYDALNELIDSIIKVGDINAVVCTGDFFHSPTPSIKTISESLSALRKLSQANIPFYCLAGNHDATDTVKDIPSNDVLHIPEIGLYSYVEPYKIIELENNIVLHFVSHHGYTAQKKTMEEVKPIEGKFNILCSHGSVYDEYLEMVLHTDAEPREVVIPEEVLKLKWDYILLGHIHDRGWVGSTDRITDTSGRKIFYGGSLFRRGFSDKECPLGRGWTEWTIEDSKMTPVFYDISQRTQIEHTILCRNKTVIDIENELEEYFKTIDFSTTPIMRIILSDINKTVKSQLNWKRFEEYTEQCLTFGTKYTTEFETKKEISGEIFSFNLLDAYKDYWEQTKSTYKEQDRELIGSISTKLLKNAQDKLLGEE